MLKVMVFGGLVELMGWLPNVRLGGTACGAGLSEVGDIRGIRNSTTAGAIVFKAGKGSAWI